MREGFLGNRYDAAHTMPMAACVAWLSAFRHPRDSLRRKLRRPPARPMERPKAASLVFEASDGSIVIMVHVYGRYLALCTCGTYPKYGIASTFMARLPDRQYLRGVGGGGAVDVVDPRIHVGAIHKK